MEICAFVDSELQGELEMITAMYGDQVTISHTESENLHRLDSSEAGYSPSPMTSTMKQQQSDNTNNTNGGHFPSSDDFHTVILLRLRKNVQIELSFPSSGYYYTSTAAKSNNTKKIRLHIDVIRTPNCIDGENLFQAMKQVVREHNIGEGALLISICQAAEQHVEAVLAGISSAGSSSEEGDSNAENEEYGSEAEYSGMMKKHSSSSSPVTAADSTTASGVVHYEGSEAATWQELVRRGCVRGSHPIADRKSKFLAHAAPISSEKEAMEIVALLREMKHINVACHPAIWAYRFTNPQTKALHYDCDDDGEKSGAKNIMFVMEQLKVDGWIVIVTRYFGGVLLQGDRFRHIATVTRSVIEEANASGVVNNNAVAVASSKKQH